LVTPEHVAGARAALQALVTMLLDDDDVREIVNSADDPAAAMAGLVARFHDGAPEVAND
jgi:hypothetical protein